MGEFLFQQHPKLLIWLHLPYDLQFHQGAVSESYNIYFYNVLKQVNPNTGIFTKALNFVPNNGQPLQIANKA